MVVGRCRGIWWWGCEISGSPLWQLRGARRCVRTIRVVPVTRDLSGWTTSPTTPYTVPPLLSRTSRHLPLRLLHNSCTRASLSKLILLHSNGIFLISVSLLNWFPVWPLQVADCLKWKRYSDMTVRVCFFPVDKKWANLVPPEVHFPEQEPWTVRSGAALFTIHCLHCIAISYVALSPPFWTFKNILWCTQLQHCAELYNICFTVYRVISSQSNTSSNTAKQVCFRLLTVIPFPSYVYWIFNGHRRPLFPLYTYLEVRSP